jgi:ribosomal protein S18 acetylase RimI-like enzyme
MPDAGTERAEVTLRGLRAGDVSGIDAIAGPEIQASLYSTSLRSAVDRVQAKPTPECRGLVAVRGARVVGVVIFGAIAGSVGAGSVQFVVVDRDCRRRGLASALIDRAIEMLATEGARVAFVELPDDPALNAVRQLLIRCGFDIDERVANYFRDGVDLLILRRDLSRNAESG